MLKRVLFPILIATVSAQAFGDDLAQANRNRILLLQQKIAQQNERIDGLTSLIEGMSAALAQIQDRTSKETQLEQRVRLLESKLAKLEMDSKQRYVPSTQSSVKKKSVSQTKYTSEDASLKAKTPSKLYSEGVRMFVKKQYDEAAKRFAISAMKGYKPAASNYYLGEIAYYTKAYDDAIFYYKKSAGLYDKAGYMDVLMLHTAISLERIGKKAQAKAFYENVVESYPGKRAAVIAKKRLKKLH
ncbi:TPR repeat containing exported protein; Putative periplasmic protein contains a protein prenylyltransferase domain [hydrothermal vent metagenome]|uniref:TPR repeat containing exported protein Putative periplasmic protein contains a protein prenylyltransferase domain n=1 Tax=hydrothermal vent metagenome TaxID=652676 RepID=A0A1W1E6Y4_9ZZZZ